MTTATAGRRIRILPEYLANQIAAGEVVERPASVVKELVENALDAGASTIEVSVEGGGLKLIRVADDGFGMGPEDAVAAFSRHATSKIISAEDLERVKTLGFRGEALPSIASVSRCSLTTAPPRSLEGTRVVLEGGSITEAKPVGCPPGTVIEVRDLFFNTPARRKFLRTPATELSQIANVVTALALANEAVTFKLISGGRTLVTLPEVDTLTERAGGLFGRQLAEVLITVAGEASGFSVSGVTSPPSLTRSSRNQQYLILDGRPFRDRRLAYAIAKAYESFVAAGRHPIAVLRFSVDPSEVDVNVHPTKQEVRFRRPGEVFDLVCGTLKSALQGVRPSPYSSPPLSEPTETLDRRKRVEEAIETFISRARPKEGAPQVRPHQEGLGSARSLQVARPQEAIPSLIQGGRYVGQIYRTYLCFESESGLILIDQHVAHERVLHEELTKQWADQRVATQELLVPLTLEMAPDEAAALEERGELLEELGFSVEPFGGQTVVVKRVPAVWGGQEVEDKARSLLRALVELDGRVPEEEVVEKVLIDASCKGALKAGRPMTEAEAHSLVESLAACRTPRVCPHGRPIVLVLEKAEIERHFQVK
jgi:DNA mismatch repair protein MutL